MGQGCQVIQLYHSQSQSHLSFPQCSRLSRMDIKLICFLCFPRDSINCPEYKIWKKAYRSGGYLPYESSRLISTIVLWSSQIAVIGFHIWWWNFYSERGFRRIPDDGSIDKKTDVLWVHQSVKLKSVSCQDTSSEECYMFWKSRAQEINEGLVPKDALCPIVLWVQVCEWRTNPDFHSVKQFHQSVKTAPK